MYKEYINQNLKIFPCKNDKSPATVHGFKDARLDWEKWSGDLIGLPTGLINSVAVIDIDNDGIAPDETLEIIEDQFGQLPPTFTVETMNGGKHLYYKTDRPLKSGNRFLKNLPVDLKADGGYVIAPDYEKYLPLDADTDNILDKCASMPEWVYSIRAEKKEKTDQETFPLFDDVIPAGARNDSITKIAGLYGSKGLDEKLLFEAVNGINNVKCDPPLSEKEIKIIVKSVCSYQEKIDNVLPERLKKKNFPKHLLNPPGLVGEFVDYINSKSIKEQPILALGAALSAIGALQGQKIQTETELRTNIYTIGIAHSGAGKEAARATIKKVFDYINIGETASAESLASDAAIISTLELYPSQIFLIDEIGRFIQTTKDSKNTHLFNIITTLLNIYSAANQKYYGKKYADSDRNQMIDNPNLCIYGTTVPHILYSGLTIDNITDGLLSRFLLFESENPDPLKNRNKNFLSPPPEELLNKMKYIRDMKKNIDGGLSIKPLIVKKTPKAEEIFLNFENEIFEKRKQIRLQKEFDSIYNRTTQTAEQIALIISGGVNIENPIITDIEMKYAVELSRHLSYHLSYITQNYISENETEINVKKVLSIIRDAGEVSLSELTRKTQSLPGYKRGDVLETLLQGGLIVENLIGTGKKKKKVYIAV